MATKINSRKKTQEQFLKEAYDTHQDETGNPLYTYEKAKYNGTHEKVIITCKIHGDFEQTPKKHIASKQGCAKCGKMKMSLKLKSSTEDFIKKAIKIHHDEEGNPLFIYDDVDYKRNDEVVIIKCKNGHIFEQTPTSHLQGNGCKFCSGSYKRDTLDFVERAMEIHKDEDDKPLYDYSLVEYKNTMTKVKIKCRKGHEFEQTPNHHLSGHGCDFCVRGVWIMNTEDFIRESNKIHGEKYDYSKSIFRGMDEKITIICPEHGEYEQIVSCHTTSERGCYKCGIFRASMESRKTVEQFILEANFIHRYIKYDYSRVHENYATVKDKVLIGCYTCKIFFEQRVQDHLTGYGCKNCKTKSATIFYAFLREEFGEDMFKTEVKFDECKYINHLPFDYYSEELNLIIELDGRQHLEEVNIFRDTLEERQMKDFIKMKYLEKMNIAIIRIFQEDVYANRYDWKLDIKNHVKKYDYHRIFYLSKKADKYDQYKENYLLFMKKSFDKSFEQIVGEKDLTEEE
jgi:very-short-patch-repair endonuclease